MGSAFETLNHDRGDTQKSRFERSLICCSGGEKNSTDIILLQIRDGSHGISLIQLSVRVFFSLIEGLGSELFFCRILLLKVLLRNIGHDREKSIGDSRVQHFSLPLEEGHVKVKCVKLGNLCRIIL